VGDVDLYKEIYRPLLMEVITVPSPDCFARAPGESWAEHSRRKFAHMEAALAQHAHEACAVIVEPLVQCAGACACTIRCISRCCARPAIVTRCTSSPMRSRWASGAPAPCSPASRPASARLHVPVQGLTAGYLPLSTVMTTEAVYAAFYDEYVKLNAFLHSHSFTGNPLACAAALASLAIFRDDQVLERNRALAARMGERARALGITRTWRKCGSAA